MSAAPAPAGPLGRPARGGLLRRDVARGRRLGELAVHAGLVAAALASGLVTVGIVVALARESLTFFADVPVGRSSRARSGAPGR